MDLFHEVVYQLLRIDGWKPGDIINGFMRINFGKLSANLGERINEVPSHFEQTRFEYRKQANWPRSDDANICFNHMSNLQIIIYRVQNPLQVFEIGIVEVFPSLHADFADLGG